MGELSAVPGNPSISQEYQDLIRLYDDEWFDDDGYPSTEDENDVCPSRHIGAKTE